MSKKGTTMATEIIRDMKRRETEAIGELSGILMDLDKVLYTLEVVQENSDIVGKSVNDGALFMMNRNRIYQNSSIAHDYVRGFEQKLAKTANPSLFVVGQEIVTQIQPEKLIHRRWRARRNSLLRR